MDEDRFNMSVRKFLKHVGVTSQRVIEEAVRSGKVAGQRPQGKNDAHGRECADQARDRGGDRRPLGRRQLGAVLRDQRLDLEHARRKAAA